MVSEMGVILLVIGLIFVVGLVLAIAAVMAVYKNDKVSNKIASLVMKTGRR